MFYVTALGFVVSLVYILLVVCSYVLLCLIAHCKALLRILFHGSYSLLWLAMDCYVLLCIFMYALLCYACTVLAPSLSLSIAICFGNAMWSDVMLSNAMLSDPMLFNAMWLCYAK